MAQTSELLRRLRRIPSERRTEFLRRLESAARDQRSWPLSFRQEQLWVLHRFDPLSHAYSLAFAFDIRGPLDRVALDSALEQVFERHEILRTTFQANGDGIPVQTATARTTPKPVEEDVRSLAGALQRERLFGAAEEDARAGFDLERGPLVRLRLLRLADEEHVLLWVTHAIVFDPESAEIVLDDLAEAYSAVREARAPRWPDLTQRYGEYADWQRRWAESTACRSLVDASREDLADWEPVDVSPDRPRVPRIDFDTARVSRPVEAGLLEAVTQRAQRQDVQPAAVLLGAYASLLTRYTGSDDVIVGMPLRSSGPSGEGRMVGNCENLVAVRIDLAGDPSFEEAASRADRALRAARAQADVPFKLVLDAVGSSPDLARLPLVQVGLTCRWQPSPTRTASDTSLTVEQIPTGTGGFELLLQVDAGRPQPRLQVEYFTSLFEAASMARFLDRLSRVLTAGLSCPEARLSQMPVISERERSQILMDWNCPATPRPLELIHAAFAEQARRSPDEIALAAAGAQLTYGELDRSSNRLAQHLAQLDVGPECRVGLFLERSPRTIEAILAVLKAGGAYVPIDTAYPADRIATILTDAAVRVVVTEGRLSERLPAGDRIVVDLDADASAIAAQPTLPPNAQVAPESLAYVLFTSGSTGRPKGVLIEHRNVTAFIRTVQAMFELSPDDRFVQFASLGYDVSVFEIFGALLSGARLYVVNEDERRSLDALRGILTQQAITVIDLPPVVMDLLDPEELPMLRVAFVGGEAFSGDLTTRWAASGCRFYNGYGPTETTVTVVAKQCDGIWTTSPPIGQAMDGHQAYALDGSLELVPVGIPGELAIAGVGLGRGYLGRPDLSAERFRPDPYGPPGSRMYLTGDRVKWLVDGELLFLGRADRQVKVRGIRIELGEIESVLAEHPGVAHAVVETRRDPRGNAVLVAYVVRRGDDPPDDASLRQYLTDRMPPSMVPSVYMFLDSIPLRPSGKVDTRALPRVDFTALGDADADEDLWTPTQRRVASEVFSPLLSVERISTQDNFFALGGTSLDAIRVIPRIRAVFGVEMPVAEFFRVPTIAGVAEVVDRLMAESVAAREHDLLAALAEVEGRSDEEIEHILATRFRQGSS
jgi:amino acid adenylation domain-containing protein